MTSKKEYIERYKALIKKNKKKIVSDTQASEDFENLISLVRSVYLSIPKNKSYESTNK